MSSAEPDVPRTALRLAPVLLGVLAVAALALQPVAPARAATNPSGTAIYGPVDFLVYVEAGERLSYRFEKTLGSGSAWVRLDGMGASGACALGAEGDFCQVSLDVFETGIWRIRYDTGGAVDASTHSAAWSIQVTDPDVVPGRVWTEQYEMANEVFDDSESFTFWYLGEFGDLYRVDYADFNGVNSTFAASAVGLVPIDGGRCTPTYRSSQREIEPNAADPNTPLRPLHDGECGGRYRIFFEEPDASLPPTATRWDGTSTWLLPPVTDPVVSDVSYSVTAPGSLAGRLRFDVAEFQGTLAIELDVDGDGDLSDPEDRVIPYFVASSDPATHSYRFNGRDGNGDPLPPDQPVTITISIDRAGELHFVNTDVETRGGMQIEALRGPAAGDTRLYWDDTSLGGAVSADKCSQTPVLDGTAGVDTSGGPVHGWEPCDDGSVNEPPTNRNNGSHGSWGDSRHIHDWTFRAVDVTSSIEVVGQALLPPTGSASAPLATLAGGALLVLGLGALALARRPRHRKG